MTMKTLILVASIVIGLDVLSAGADSLTMTTYYPAPSGNYAQIQTTRLGVGTANQPNRDGDIRLTAQAGDPTTWPVGAVGQVAYSSANDGIYYSNGSAWVGSGSSSAVMYLSCAWQNTINITTCTPPSCPSGWTSAGTSNEATSSYYDSLYNNGYIYGKSTRVGENPGTHYINPCLILYSLIRQIQTCG